MSLRLGDLWRTGGLILALAFLTLFVGGGARFAIGLVLKPMAESLDWDRTALGAVIAVFMTVTALAMVAVGRLSDKHPPGLILAGGFLLSAIGVGAMSLVEAAWQAFLLYGIVFAIGNGAVSITPVGVMLTRRFGDRAGTANAIAISGMGLGQLMIISVLAAVLENAGWRDVFIWLGLVNLAAAPLLLLSVRRDGKRKAASQPAQTGMPAMAAMRHRGFWALLVVYAICGFQDFFVSSHVVAFALDQGTGAFFAGNLLAFMGLAGLVGVLSAGAISDWRGAAWPTAACFVLRIAIFALISVAKDPLSIAVFALVYGLTFWVTAPLTAIFVRDLFGPKHLGAITGLVTMAHHMAGGLGALLGAALFDRDGDYQTAFLVMLALSIVGAVATFTIPKTLAAR